jgi:hypothetical protein
MAEDTASSWHKALKRSLKRVAGADVSRCREHGVGDSRGERGHSRFSRAIGLCIAAGNDIHLDPRRFGQAENPAGSQAIFEAVSNPPQNFILPYSARIGDASKLGP